MVFGAQPSLQPGEPTRFALTKFSFANLPIHHVGPIRWTHVRDNLAATIDSVSSPSLSSKCVRLRVWHSRQILEEINLSQFVRDAIRSQSFSQFATGKPPCVVKVRVPCVAMKYPWLNAHSRQFQLQFTAVRDYYALLAILSDLGCPLTESAAPAQHLAAASSVPRRPPVPLWQSSRPSSSSTVYEDSSARSTVAYSPESNQAFVASHCSSNTVPREHSPVLSYSTNETSTRLTADLPSEKTGGDLASLAEMSQPMDNRHSQTERLPLSRSASAIVYHDSQTLDKLLPPKRDLPFQKPAPPKLKKRAIDDTTQPVSGDQGSGQTRKKPQGGRRQRPATANAALPRPSSSNGQATQESIGQPSAQAHPKKRAPSTSSKARPASSTGTGPEPVLATENNHSNKCPVASQIQPTTTQAPHATTPDHNVPTDMTLIPTIPNLTIPTGNATGAATSHTPSASLSMELITTADLTAYLSTPDSQRASLVETWVCQQLEDDGFVQLCRDVEGVWQRIALGVKSA